MSNLRKAIKNLSKQAAITVTRHERGTYDADTGEYVPGSSSTFEVKVNIQPAFGLNRVVGGSDTQGHVDNQKTTSVYNFYSTVELKPREEPSDASPGFDTDIVRYKNADWTVSRVEEWELDPGDTYWHCVIEKRTGGGA